ALSPVCLSFGARFRIAAQFEDINFRTTNFLEFIMRRVLFLILVFALAAAIIAAARSASTMAASAGSARLEQELKDADLKFARETKARRLEGWMDSFADDASTISNGKVITGKAALREYYKKVFADNDL